MAHTPLVTVLSYSTLERPYVGAVVQNAVAFSDLVVVCIGTRLYSGEDEDVEAAYRDDVLRPLLSDADRRKVILVAYDVPSVVPAGRHTSYLHNTARLAGVRRARAEMGPTTPNFWALMLDGDEVPEGARFAAWWAANRATLSRRTVYKMANHWAFLHPRLVADAVEDSVVLVHSSILDYDALMHPRERDGIYLWHWSSSSPTALGSSDESGVQVQRNVSASEPLFWHFSWVRGLATRGDWDDAIHADSSDWSWLPAARAGILAKVAKWGHRNDRDWVSVIDDTFAAVSSTHRWPTHDFVHGHALRVLPALPRSLLLMRDS